MVLAPVSNPGPLCLLLAISGHQDIDRCPWSPVAQAVFKSPDSKTGNRPSCSYCWGKAYSCDFAHFSLVTQWHSSKSYQLFRLLTAPTSLPAPISVTQHTLVLQGHWKSLLDFLDFPHLPLFSLSLMYPPSFIYLLWRCFFPEWCPPLLASPALSLSLMWSIRDGGSRQEQLLWVGSTCGMACPLSCSLLSHGAK